MLIVTFKNFSLLVMLISSWLTMRDYSHIAVLFVVRINGNSIRLVLINAANPGIAVRELLHIPFNTHVRIIGPLIKRNNLRVQLQFRNFQFLLNAFNSTNDIVKTCIQSAMYSYNIVLDINLLFIVINILRYA